MAWKASDTLFFLSLGAFTFVAVKGVAYALRENLRLTQIHEQPQKQICAISQETEDALDARSLAVLGQSHDRPTKEAALRILSDRFVRDPSAVTDLCRDVYSSSSEVRARGLILLRMLESHASDPGPLQFLSQAQNNANRNNNEHTMVFPFEMGEASSLREREESFEEQEVRRRRREAVVFHDGAGPISQDDIIQRAANGAPVQGREQVLTRVMEDALREISAQNGWD